MEVPTLSALVAAGQHAPAALSAGSPNTEGTREQTLVAMLAESLRASRSEAVS